MQPCFFLENLVDLAQCRHWLLSLQTFLLHLVVLLLINPPLLSPFHALRKDWAHVLQLHLLFSTSPMVLVRCQT